MKTLKVVTAIFAISLLISSCAKDGAPGATGPAGPTGSGGANGTNGVANITTTEYSVLTGSWRVYGGGIDSVWLPVPALTDSINDVVIITVARTTGLFANEWSGLPMSNFLATGDELDYLYGKQRILLAYSPNAPTMNLDFKISVIPPAIMKQHPKVDWKNKAEVLALPEVQQALNK